MSLVGVYVLPMLTAMPPAPRLSAPASSEAERAALKAAQRKEAKQERRFARRDAKAIAAYIDKKTSKAAPNQKTKPAPLVAGFDVNRAVVAKMVSVAYVRLDEAGNYGYDTKTLPPPLDVYDPDGHNFTGRRVFDDELIKDCTKTVPDDYKQAIANARRHNLAEMAQRD